MSDFSLYNSCLRKIAINLRDGIYKTCHENPFSVMPSKIVNDIMSATLEHQQTDGFRADDLEQLLTSGKLLELKISFMIVGGLITILQEIIKVLNFLKSGCQKLEILYLPWILQRYRTWLRSEVSVARTRSEVFAARLRSEISEALGNVLENTPNLKDLHSSFSFDLKALRNCRKLRRLRLHFLPQQHWYEFLTKEKGHFLSHKCLEFFTVCHQNLMFENVPYDDVVIILQHCPELTSLGFIESSGALSQLHRMNISPSELKLRHCCWRDREFDLVEYPSQPPDYGLHRVREAVLNYPVIEELDFEGCCLRSMRYLENLRNLVYLKITFDNRSGDAFNDVLQAIGPQLKHLSFHAASPMDLSLLLQNCHNLESLRITSDKFTVFAIPAVSLPNLQRLALKFMPDNGRRVFPLLCGCNQLTELFLLNARYFDDQILHHFLERNSLSNLKVAFLPMCGLTEHGFRELLLNAPQLERVRIFSSDFGRNHFERVITNTNHKALYDKYIFAEDEFFERRRQHDGY
ncbi:hypothetical protein AVEN_10770-1 [Araneus ventricosus]|uniref:F-box domain-containing protein n=1 Tax=Araneus ventricosus TaxID=182803 RepID=A0A4Y2PWK9_ARAVE|nr:hypothetical protein AVEN_10770-1 [Araneus ventricosus]